MPVELPGGPAVLGLKAISVIVGSSRRWRKPAVAMYGCRLTDTFVSLPAIAFCVCGGHSLTGLQHVRAQPASSTNATHRAERRICAVDRVYWTSAA